MKKNEEKFLKNSISPNSRYSIIQKKSVSFMDTPFFVIPYYDYLKIN